MIGIDKVCTDGTAHVRTTSCGDGWLGSLEQANRERDHVELAQLMLKAATASMTMDDDESLEHAQWLFSRAHRSLGMAPPCRASLRLRCELMDRMLLLARQWRSLCCPVQAHVVNEMVRDSAFEAARQVEAITDSALRVSVILCCAESLESLGDHQDANVLRVRAFHRLAVT